MENGGIIHLTAENFDSEVLNSKVPVLVDFWATWCGPCRMVGPIIEELAQNYAGRAKVCKLDVDEQQSIAAKYRVMTIPTVFVFKNGEIVERTVGARPKQAFAQMLDAHL